MHSVCTSAASVADSQMLADSLHGEERTRIKLREEHGGVVAQFHTPIPQRLGTLPQVLNDAPGSRLREAMIVYLVQQLACFRIRDIDELGAYSKTRRQQAAPDTQPPALP